MKLTYTLTLGDYKAAQVLHRRQKFTRQLAVWILPALTLFGLAAMVAFSLTNHPELFADSMALVGGALFITIFMPVARWYAIRRCFMQLFPPTRTDRSSAIDIDDERILSAVPGVSEGKIFWQGLLQFAQDNKVTMLYLSEIRFILFPTSVLTPEQRAELKGMMTRHGVKAFIC
jgi:hypothetical protein